MIEPEWSVTDRKGIYSTTDCVDQFADREPARCFARELQVAFGGWELLVGSPSESGTLESRKGPVMSAAIPEYRREIEREHLHGYLVIGVSARDEVRGERKRSLSHWTYALASIRTRTFRRDEDQNNKVVQMRPIRVQCLIVVVYSACRRKELRDFREELPPQELTFIEYGKPIQRLSTAGILEDEGSEGGREEGDGPRKRRSRQEFADTSNPKWNVNISTCDALASIRTRMFRRDEKENKICFMKSPRTFEGKKSILPKKQWRLEPIPDSRVPVVRSRFNRLGVKKRPKEYEQVDSLGARGERRGRLERKVASREEDNPLRKGVRPAARLIWVLEIHFKSALQPRTVRAVLGGLRRGATRKVRVVKKKDRTNLDVYALTSSRTRELPHPKYLIIMSVLVDASRFAFRAEDALRVCPATKERQSFNLEKEGFGLQLASNPEKAHNWVPGLNLQGRLLYR
ncbi:hypothetical protein C8R46DRAFT_1253012 [Mycena filopes]|nr:hypothetical protein C8R46DRAFT_1253012 [Mycena filopes]